MAFSTFNRLPIEYIMDAATPWVIILLGFIQVFVCAILGWDNKIYAYFLGSKSGKSSSSSSSVVQIEQSNLKKTEDNDDQRVCLEKGDLDIVYKRLRLFSENFSGFGSAMYGFRVTEGGNFVCGAVPAKRVKMSGADCSTYGFEKSPLFSSAVNVGKLEEIWDSETVSKLFDGEEEDVAAVKAEELKAAFDVYDENKDGFIDEFELQRVLCGLGFKEGLKIDDCKKMIVLGDTNGDGRLDFNEFVTFLQNSL